MIMAFPRAVFASILAALLVALPGFHGDVFADARKKVGAAIEICETILDVGEGDGDVIDAIIDNLAKEAKEATGGAGSTDPEEEPKPISNAEELAAAARDVAPDRPPPPARVLKQAKDARAAVKNLARQSRKALDLARQAPTPEKAREHLKTAMQHARQVKEINERLGKALVLREPLDLPTAPKHRIKPLVINDKGKVFNRLRTMVDRNPDVAWGGVDRSRLGKLKGGTNFFKGHYDDKRKVLVLEDGGEIETGVVERALKQAAPKLAPKRLFNKVPSPNVSGPRVDQNRKTLKALYAPGVKDAIEKDGGVELEVTLDLLSLVGAPGFRVTGPATIVEQPVLISLHALLAALARHADSEAAWARLPERLRFPGGIERVNGFVLDYEREDIFLVGTMARHPTTRMDVDAIVIGLRAVYRENRTPRVSLDALPDDPGGPQYVRFNGVPADTTFAQIMVEADYAMKRIVSGDLKVTAAGFRSYLDLLADDPSDLRRNRWWLYPKALSDGKLHLSATGRTALFDTGLKLLTEAERIVAGAVTGTGQTSPIGMKVAELFTRAYDDIERSAATQSKGVFVRLHGLVDIVTLCRLWQRMGIDFDVIERFADLPVRRLRGREAVPTYYPGLTRSVSVVVDGQRGALSVSGGVQMRTRVSGRAGDTYQDSATTTLERAVDGFPRDGSFARRIDQTIVIPRAGDGVGPATRLMALAGASLARGRFAKARELYRKVTRLDPQLTDAWMRLAVVEDELGDPGAAVFALGKALVQEPDNEALRRATISFLIKSDADVDPDSWPEPLRREVSDEFIQIAMYGWTQENLIIVRAGAERALAVWEDNPDGYFFRAVSRADTSRAWQRDLKRAIRLYKREMKISGGDYGSARLALALGWQAQRQRREIANMNVESLLADPASARHLFEIVDDAIDSARESARQNPRLPWGPTMEVELRGYRVGLQQAIGAAWDLQPIVRRAAEIAERFSDFAPAHRARASVLALAEDEPGAISALDRALDLNPTLHGALGERAALKAYSGNCRAARADLKRAEQLGLEVAPEIKDFVARCK